MILRYLLCLIFCMAAPRYIEGQTITEFREVVTYLADDERQGRDTASKGIYAAQQYIAKELRDYGFDARYQEFTTPKGKCRNIIAWVQGASDQYMVVGAHLDHVGVRGRTVVVDHKVVRRPVVLNGADDNASGSAMVLALAKRFKDEERRQGIVPLPHSIVFVWFTGEEHGFWGSQYFVDNPVLPNAVRGQKLPIFMLNLDMVGRLAGYGQVWKNEAPVPLTKILDDLFTRYAFAQKITFRDGSDSSDHYPFHRKGIPIVMLHTGLHQDYHRSTDDADKIHYNGMVQIFECAFDLLMGVIYMDGNNYDFVNELPPYKESR